MSDIATVSRKILEALDAVNALRAGLNNLLLSVNVPQPPQENNTVSQPDPDTTQKVQVVTPHVEQGTTGGNFSA